MILYPAIDMKQGRCVRLIQGDAAQSTDYGDPVAAAKRWAGEGAQWIHLVDLDGALEGEARNLPVIGEIARVVDVKLQLGGGIRTMAGIEERLIRTGVTRVVLGTVALENPALVREACRLFPGRIAVGIDARAGKVAVRGWVEQSDIEASDLALRMKDAGVEVVVYTDIGRDGMLSGPNAGATLALAEQTGMTVIASGGIGSLGDVRALRRGGCAGAILGKALYSGQFTLGEALDAAR